MFDESQEHKTGIKVRGGKSAAVDQRYYRSSGVYIIVASNGLCKIGQTESLYKRIASLWTMIPEEFELYAFFPTETHVFAEETLHRFVCNRRVKGEWFALNEKDLARVIGFYGFDLINKKASEFLETYSR